MARSFPTTLNSRETANKMANVTVPSTPKSKIAQPRGSLPTDFNIQSPLEFQWPPPIPVSSNTTNLRLNMMNQDPKDLHTARAIIEELRSKVRFQTEHIIKWRKAYATQMQQHYRYQKEKTEQMNSLTSQLLLLESRLKRKQKQISNLLQTRESTIQRQQKVIDNLSTCLSNHGIKPLDTSYTAQGSSFDDSDSAVVLDYIDSDSTMASGSRRNSSNDGITVVRSISDAIDANLNKYGVTRRNNCFLKRPDILETVYSVEEDPEPTLDVAERRDKFKHCSEKALSSSLTESQLEITIAVNNNNSSHNNDKAKDMLTNICEEQLNIAETHSSTKKNIYDLQVPHLRTTTAAMDDDIPPALSNYNRVMSNHRSVTKPKDVKFKRINKAKSKSLEELRGRLKNFVERGNTFDSSGAASATATAGCPNNGCTLANVIPQTAHFYA